MNAKLYLLLGAALLGGCVNLHVYFPEAHDPVSQDTAEQNKDVKAQPAEQPKTEPAK